MTSTRKSLLAIAGLASAGLMFTACGTTGGTPAPGTGSSQAACDLKIAYMGPLTGDNANLGLNMTRGAQVALDTYNKDHADCKVTLQTFDSQGDPEKATPLASQIVNDAKIIGLVGPAFSGETQATGATFSEAGLVTVSPSATRTSLSSNGWKTFHRVIGNDDTQAPAAAKYIQDTLKASKVFVVNDATDYGKPLAEGVQKTLGSLVAGTDTVQQKQTDFSATVTKIKASGAEALFYAGYYSEAGLLAKQLKNGGWGGTFVSGDGSLDKGFVVAAGAAAANGAVLTCPCAPAETSFTDEFKAVNGGEEPGTYSTESYDAINVLLQGIAAGKTERSTMLEFVNSYDAKGITKQIKFSDTGEVSTVVVYAYKVSDGVIQPGTPIE